MSRVGAGQAYAEKVRQYQLWKDAGMPEPPRDEPQKEPPCDSVFNKGTFTGLGAHMHVQEGVAFLALHEGWASFCHEPVQEASGLVFEKDMRFGAALEPRRPSVSFAPRILSRRFFVIGFASSLPVNIQHAGPGKWKLNLQNAKSKMSCNFLRLRPDVSQHGLPRSLGCSHGDC